MYKPNFNKKFIDILNKIYDINFNDFIIVKSKFYECCGYTFICSNGKKYIGFNTSANGKNVDCFQEIDYVDSESCYADLIQVGSYTMPLEYIQYDFYQCCHNNENSNINLIKQNSLDRICIFEAKNENIFECEDLIVIFKLTNIKQYYYNIDNNLEVINAADKRF